MPRHLYLEEPQWSLKEQGFWLRLTTCCAKIAGLFALLAFVVLIDSRDRHLEATEGPRQVCFCWCLMKLPRGSHRWPSSLFRSPHFSCLHQRLHRFLLHFPHFQVMFRLLNFSGSFLLPFFCHSHLLVPHPILDCSTGGCRWLLLCTRYNYTRGH